MDKTVNTRNYTGKSAVCGHAYDCYLYGISDLVIVLENNPRVILRLLIAERNLPLLGIERLYVNLNGIAYKNNL